MHTGCYHTWTDEHNGPAVSISSSDLRPEQWPSDCTHDWRPAQIRLPEITLVLLSFAAIDPPSTRGLASTVFLRSPSPWHATIWGVIRRRCEYSFLLGPGQCLPPRPRQDEPVRVCWSEDRLTEESSRVTIEVRLLVPCARCPESCVLLGRRRKLHFSLKCSFNLSQFL